MAPIEGSLAQQFARISQELHAQPATEETLQRVVDLAVQTVHGCDLAGVSWRHDDGRVDTPASTDPSVEEADRAQYELREGPCLDAIWVDDTFLIDNMLEERRWPRWAPRAAALGMRSILSVRLATPKDLVGGLNLYSRTVRAFDDEAVVTAHVYAAHASNAIAATREVEHLQTALQSRHLIGVAQGLLMQRYGLSEEAAFRVLSRHSQETNVKLREVAARLVAEFKASGGLP